MKFPRKMRSLLGVLAVMGLAAVVVWQLDGSSESGLALLSEGWQDREFSSKRERSGQSPQPRRSDDDEEPIPEGQSEPAGLPEDETGATAVSSGTDGVLFGDQSAAALTEFRRLRLTGAESLTHDPSKKENTRAAKENINQQISPSQLSSVDQLIENGDDLAAHKKLSAWYWNFPQDRPRFQRQIEALAKSIYFSPQPHYEDAYVIQPGDQLRRIAKQYKLSWQYLARLNRANPRKIRAGQKLKVLQGPFDAVIDLSGFQLTVICRGQYVRRYRVGIGKEGSSPLGKFTVKEKLEDPVYYGPDGVIGNDDPENPLGERWIDIGDGFGIHGTIDPASIGKSESRGCIRMINEDVEEVYDFLTVGSTVWIRR